jgi:DNA-binding MarR family transcriptional regulator
MTNRLDRLEQAGYVRRLPNPQDRRGTLVQLTEKGRQLVDQAVEVHVSNEQRLVSALSAEERDQLNSILSRWLQSFEDAQDSPLNTRSTNP